MHADRRLVVALSVLAALFGCDRGRESAGPVAATNAGSGSSTARSQDRTQAPNPSTNTVYMCPMDKDIRSNDPGKCPRCGMKLVTSIPDPVEYHLDLDVSPAPTPGTEVRLSFAVSDPWKGNPVTRFEVIHEKLFHAFIVSQDLAFFRHGHPVFENGRFVYDVALPRAGVYRILGDFYPEAATPQLLTHTLIVPGRAPAPVKLHRDYRAKQAENMKVSFVAIPERPRAGIETRLRFLLDPADGVERYLGVWAHMLTASDDLVDMMHIHPSIADGSAELEFKVVFPRPRVYRVWVQFQRKGVVNTAHFDVPVQAPPSGSGLVVP